MLFNPSIFVQLLVSFSCTVTALLAAGSAVQIIRHWDINSGAQTQLIMERRTYLISTLLFFCFAAQLAAFLFFIQTCESISPQFVGAMCATGVLNANPYGWPLLFLKILIFFGSTTWILINHLDNKGVDYPLIKIKYGLLLAILPLLMFETVHLYLFFSGLTPDLIVSCCGALFSATAKGVAANVSGLAPKTAVTALGISAGIFLPAGILYGRWGGSGYFFGILGIGAFITALTAMVSFIGLYIYAHPHHHCPFCMLKSGYHFKGYFLFLPLFFGTAAAVGTTAVKMCSGPRSIAPFIQPFEKSLARFSFSMFAAFYALVIWVVFRSNLTMAFWYT